MNLFSDSIIVIPIGQMDMWTVGDGSEKYVLYNPSIEKPLWIRKINDNKDSVDLKCPRGIFYSSGASLLHTDTSTIKTPPTHLTPIKSPHHSQHPRCPNLLW
jgi:hypothetical protein